MGDRRLHQQEEARQEDLAARRHVASSTKRMVATTKQIHAASKCEQLAAAELRRAAGEVKRLQSGLNHAAVVPDAHGVEEAMERWRRCCGGGSETSREALP